jgi:hypothetical protein
MKKSNPQQKKRRLQMVRRALSMAVVTITMAFTAFPCLAQTYSMCHYDNQGRLVRAEKSNGISLSYRYDKEDTQPHSILKASAAAASAGDQQTQKASGCQVRVKRSPSPIPSSVPN